MNAKTRVILAVTPINERQVATAAAGQLVNLTRDLHKDGGKIEPLHGDGDLKFRTAMGAHVTTGMMPQVEIEKIDDEIDEGGSLVNSVPSLFMTINGQVTQLTWMDAVNIARSLESLVSVGYYG